MLNELLGFQAGPLFTFLTFVVVCSRFGYFIDNKVSLEYRELVRESIKRAVPQNKMDFTALFLPIFDKILLTSTAKRPGLLRSITVSASILMLVGFVWILTSSSFDKSFESFISYPWKNIVIFLVLGTAINVIGDYLSLWESRILIGLLPYVNLLCKPLVILLDLMFTVICFLISCLAGLYILNWLPGFYANVPDALSLLRIVLLEGIFFPQDIRLEVHLLAIYFWTTLFTSVWLWIFVVGSVLWPFIGWARRVLDIEKYPIGSVMTVGSILVGMAGLAASNVFKLVG